MVIDPNKMRFAVTAVNFTPVPSIRATPVPSAGATGQAGQVG